MHPELHVISTFSVFSKLRLTSLSILSESEGLNTAVAPVLRILVKTPNITQVEIANKLMQAQASVTKNLMRMEKNGLITKTQDEDDGRKFRINPTTLGITKFNNLVKKIIEFEANIYDGMTESEKDNFIMTMRKVNTCLSEFVEAHED